MTPNDAAAALAHAGKVERKLAERAHWPFHRHAMFGLAEGLIVAGIAQPVPMAAAMTAVSLSLLVVCIMDDRRRHGMFVSGWQPGATRPMTLLLSLFVVAMLITALLVRDGESVQPLGFLIGAFTFAVCTWASLRWERIYRSQLRRGDAA